MAAGLVELREAANLSQRQAAKRAGVDQADLSRIESGQCTPSLPTLLRLLDAVGGTLIVGRQGATVLRLANESPDESAAITRAAMFLGDIKIVEEHRALSIWMDQLVPVDPSCDLSTGLDHHEGRFRAAQERPGVEVTAQAEAPADRFRDCLVTVRRRSGNVGMRGLLSKCATVETRALYRTVPPGA